MADTAVLMDLKNLLMASAILVSTTSCVANLELSETDGGSDPVGGGSEETDSGESTASGSMGAAATVGGDRDWISEFSEGRCEALFACGCERQTLYIDQETCIAVTAEALTEREAAAGLVGADRFSSSCYASKLEHLTGDTCGPLAPPASFTTVMDAAYCPLFVGASEEGEACLGPSRSLLAPFDKGDSSCAEGLYCEESVCVRLPSEGEACLPEGNLGQCASPLACIDEACVPRREPGEPCDLIGQCEESLWCVEGVCVPRGAVGGSCMTGFDCISASCIDDVCQPPVPALCGPYSYVLE